MEKFKSDHHELEVVQYTKPGDLFLMFFLQTELFCIAEFATAIYNGLLVCPFTIVIITIIPSLLLGSFT